MNLFPRRQFTISTRLRPDQALAQVREAIGSVPWSLGRQDPRPFMGTMTGTSFSITRVSRGRNSFRPLIRASIEAAPEGSRVTGTMQLHSVVLVFMGLLIALPTWLFLNMLGRSVATGSWDMTMLVLPGAVVFLLAMLGFGFVVESRRALEGLAAIVEGDSRSNE